MDLKRITSTTEDDGNTYFIHLHAIPTIITVTYPSTSLASSNLLRISVYLILAKRTQVILKVEPKGCK